MVGLQLAKLPNWLAQAELTWIGTGRHYGLLMLWWKQKKPMLSVLWSAPADCGSWLCPRAQVS